jgi:hypothetical protein
MVVLWRFRSQRNRDGASRKDSCPHRRGIALLRRCLSRQRLLLSFLGTTSLERASLASRCWWWRPSACLGWQTRSGNWQPNFQAFSSELMPQNLHSVRIYRGSRLQGSSPTHLLGFRGRTQLPH